MATPPARPHFTQTVLVMLHEKGLLTYDQWPPLLLGHILHKLFWPCFTKKDHPPCNTVFMLECLSKPVYVCVCLSCLCLSVFRSAGTLLSIPPSLSVFLSACLHSLSFCLFVSPVYVPVCFSLSASLSLSLSFMLMWSKDLSSESVGLSHHIVM